MPPTQSAPAVVVVPIKGFGGAKARLGSVLDGAERAALARSLATTVLAAAAPLPVLVVTDDDEVTRFATDRGASVLRQVEPGLNAAVTEAVAHLAAAGTGRAVIAHADLPRATTLSGLTEAGDGVVIVPDRHDDGTNVLSVPTGAGFTFAYGAASFAAHVAEAERLGLPVAVVRDPDLAWDVDTPDDLDVRDHRGA